MKKRCDRLARALALSVKLWRLEEQRLVQCVRRLEELRLEERKALEALHGLCCEPTVTLCRLRELATQRADAERLYEEQVARTRILGRRARQTERLYGEAQAQYKESEAKAELKRLTERSPVSVP